MRVMEIKKQFKDSKHEYTLLGADEPTHVNINNHRGGGAVIVPIDKLKELLNA